MFGLVFFCNHCLMEHCLQYALTASQACIILMSACSLYPQPQEAKYGKVYLADSKLSEDFHILLCISSIPSTGCMICCSENFATGL